MRFNVVPTLATNVSMERRFGEDTLPKTVETARRFKPDVLRHLAAVHPAWPFEDRVLLWLLPNLEAEAVRFHDRDGPALDRIFQSHQLESIDRDLVLELLKRLDA